MTPYEIDAQAKLLLERFVEPSDSALHRLLLAAGIHEYLEQVMPVLAKVAREEEGHTWADVGEVLQITRQAAFQRLGRQPFLYPDGKGGQQIVDPDSQAYLDSLRQAREQLRNEPGRASDVRIIDDYLKLVEAGGAGDDEVVLLPVVQEVEVEVEVPVAKRRPSRKK
jgi:hypothetical protein